MDNESQITKCNETDIMKVDINTLKDIQDVKVNTQLPVKERMADFVKQIEDPYCFRCGKLVVQIIHSESDTTINDCLKEYIKSQAY